MEGNSASASSSLLEGTQTQRDSGDACSLIGVPKLELLTDESRFEGSQTENTSFLEANKWDSSSSCNPVALDSFNSPCSSQSSTQPLLDCVPADGPGLTQLFSPEDTPSSQKGCLPLSKRLPTEEGTCETPMVRPSALVFQNLRAPIQGLADNGSPVVQFSQEEANTTPHVQVPATIKRYSNCQGLGITPNTALLDLSITVPVSDGVENAKRLPTSLQSPLMHRNGRTMVDHPGKISSDEHTSFSSPIVARGPLSTPSLLSKSYVVALQSKSGVKRHSEPLSPNEFQKRSCLEQISRENSNPILENESEILLPDLNGHIQTVPNFQPLEENEHYILYPNRVFARFNQRFYPATAIPGAAVNKDHVLVRFEDEQEYEIPKSYLGLLDIRPGDDLRGYDSASVLHLFTVTSIKKKYAKSISTCIRGCDTVLGLSKKSNEEVEIAISKIYLTMTMLKVISQRPYNPSVSHLNLSTDLIGSQSREKSDTPQIFSRACFAISWGHGDLSSRNQVVSKIEQHGGLVLAQGLDELFSLSSKDDIVTLDLKEKLHDYDFACVIAEDFTRSIRYFQALALGLPCLAAQYIDSCIAAKKMVDWQGYLLAAGKSDWLGGCIKSMQVAPFKGTLKHRFDDESNQQRWLNKKRVVFVTEKEVNQEELPALFLLCSLGAQVVLVQGLDAAKAYTRHLGDQCVLYLDDGVSASKKDESNSCLVRREWLTQSLILGRPCTHDESL